MASNGNDAGAGPKRPNLIMFMPDQLRYDCLGCTGNKEIRTPNIDAFCKEGNLFENCFAQSSVCAQSRCSMFLGQYPHVSGHRSLETLVQEWEPNMFRSLKENGYHIAQLGPRGHLYAEGVTETGVHEYGFLVPPGCEDPMRAMKQLQNVSEMWARLFYGGKRDAQAAFDYDEAVCQSAVEWLQSSPPEPFCLFMPLIWPHCPFEAEEPYISMYDRAKMPAPVPATARTGYEPRYMGAIRDRYGLNNVGQAEWAEVIATYYGMITRLDDQFGRIMKVVHDKGFWDNAATMFFTDHGEYLGDYGLIEKWPAGLSNSLTQNPLIIGGGFIPGGGRIHQMCEMVDLLPTVFEMCGTPETFPHNGKSLVPLLHGSKEEHKSHAYSEGGFLTSEEWLVEQAPFPYDLKAALQHEDTTLVGKATACRNKTWTYIYRLYEPAELYNRMEDPGEVHNLAGLPQYAHIEAQMEKTLFRWLFETADLLPWKRDPGRPRVSLKDPRTQLEQRNGVAK